MRGQVEEMKVEGCKRWETYVSDILAVGRVDERHR